MITTLDGALAGMQFPREFMKSATGTLVAGRPHNLRYLAGYPGAGVAPTPGIGGEQLTTLSGQLPFSNPVSGNTYLSRLQAQAGQAGTLLLIDRLWQNSGLDVTLTTEQVFTASAAIPSRDANGAANGDQVYAAVEVSGATGAGTPTMTLKYVNSLGTTGQLATSIFAGIASSIQGSWYPIGLAAGDVGIQKATSLQLSATWTSGTIHLVLYRILARLELQAQIPNAIDALTGGFTRMYNNSVPELVFYPNTTTTSIITGQAIWSQG